MKIAATFAARKRSLSLRQTTHPRVYSSRCNVAQLRDLSRQRRENKRRVSVIQICDGARMALDETREKRKVTIVRQRNHPFPSLADARYRHVDDAQFFDEI